MAKKKSKTRLRFEKFDTRGIPLAEVIAIHRQFRGKNALPGNLGDGFLCATNPVFGNLRRRYLELGFSFSETDFCDYYAFPLMSLDTVIEAEKIPYRKNFPWLEVLEKQAPGKFTLTELKRSEIQFNYLFHESAHFIAHREFFGRKKFSMLPKDKETLLKILLGEAFANTVEALGSAFPEGEVGGYFLDANCHFRANEKEVRALQRGAKKIGWTAAARILLAAFLYSNFMFEKLNKDQRARIFQFSGLGKKQDISALINIGLQLSEQFRTTTTHFHLMKLGFPASLEKLMAYDPLAALLSASGEKTRKSALALTEIATEGLMPV